MWTRNFRDGFSLLLKCLCLQSHCVTSMLISETKSKGRKHRSASCLEKCQYQFAGRAYGMEETLWLFLKIAAAFSFHIT